MSTLADKVAVITGATAGIGTATARELSATGCRLVLTGRRRDRLEALAAELGGDIAVLAADIGDTDTPQKLLDLATARFGHADILVNNAGILRIGGHDTFDLDTLPEVTNVNFMSVVRASYIFARAMKPAGTGAIVNVSSIGAHVNFPLAAVYGALKRALEMFTDSLRIELAGSGVRVSLVAPGTTSTEIFDDMKSQGQKGWDEYVTPLQPEDIARAVRFILEQPARANIPRVHVYASADTA